VAPDQAPALTVCDHWDKGVATVTVHGEIDLSTVSTFSERLGDVARKNPQRLVINLTDVDFLDSTGLHAFVRIRKELPEDCPIVLRSPRQQVRRVFEITGLSPVFTFE
jgi:anti-sigma B factor antagonist